MIMAARKKTGKAIATWDEELAKAAEQAAEMEANAGGGQFFSTRGGILSWQDAPLPNNEMAVVVLDTIFENVFYEGDYDPEVPQGPTCFAFGRDEKELAPHSAVIELGWAQSLDGCHTCENNEWGSANKGKGKACRNTRRLAMIPAGNFDRDGKLELFEDEDHYASTAIGFMKLPVTSVKGYASFVKQVAGALKRPPFGIVTRVSVVPDPKTQFKVLFEPIMSLPDDIMGAVMQRVEEAKTVIDFPYQLEEEESAPPPRAKTKKKTAVKKAAPRRGSRKY
jgi:hypothetical protein